MLLPLTFSARGRSPREELLLLGRAARDAHGPINEDKSALMMDIVKPLKLFQRVKDRALKERICGFLNYEMREKGEAIYSRGGPAEKLYIIVSGEVEIPCCDGDIAFVACHRLRRCHSQRAAATCSVGVGIDH